MLHVKPYPYYVSDAMTADVVDCLRRLAEAPGEAGRIGSRLWEAMATGRLEVRAHPFFCAPLPYEEMPEDLRSEFAAATVTILKGDLNYRRLVGDRLWAETTPFADRTAYFPRGRRCAAHTEVRRDRGVGAEDAGGVGGAGTVRRGLAYERYARPDPGSRADRPFALNHLRRTTHAEQRTETRPSFTSRRAVLTVSFLVPVPSA